MIRHPLTDGMPDHLSLSHDNVYVIYDVHREHEQAFFAADLAPGVGKQQDDEAGSNQKYSVENEGGLQPDWVDRG